MSRETGIGRRALLQRALVGGAAFGLGEWAALVPARAAADAKPVFRNALSVSPFTEAVLAGCALTDGSFTARSVADVQRLFIRHGGCEVYARFATVKEAPQGDAEHGFVRGLERAALAKQLDLPFNPEIMCNGHYGDAVTYSDPPDFRDYPEIAGAQPGPWTSLTLDQMVPLIRAYAAAVARQILGTGARVD